MAKHWYIETSATAEEVQRVARSVFFTRPSLAERAKVWSKAAQLQSNIKWEEVRADGAVLAAEVVSGGMREAIGASKNGGGSMIGTTIAMSIGDNGAGRVVEMWLRDYNTFMGMNQQGDVLKSYTRQVAKALIAGGATATAHK